MLPWGNNRPTLARLWSKTNDWPMGRQIFSKILGQMAPYTGSIGATVLEISDGHAVVELRERRGVRNHLSSIHAIALMNLGEVATGLAVMHSIDGRGRGIIVRLSMDYLKKARGTITATCDGGVPTDPGRHDVEVVATLRNTDGDAVARATATWKIDIDGNDQAHS